MIFLEAYSVGWVSCHLISSWRHNTLVCFKPVHIVSISNIHPRPCVCVCVCVREERIKFIPIKDVFCSSVFTHSASLSCIAEKVASSV